ncbi:Major Facilitator Superfamily protein [Saccharopolyspora antimicrobica]|uniref:MFS transporter n=1 Tax=Saccharopolyspora antimicrobica TaxID=455193 RepID=A0A1I4VRW1_9PSEU|nr:MFS transporter [Saccharopolyspora antimicrobica]RKT87249.1 MFS transporter [Saccharopolyspora antimicrobica]SFN03716.1 Major Facilitator Superfamily protein [Saccharopolyspora antimicrobica]
MNRVATVFISLTALFLVPFTLSGASVALIRITEDLDTTLAATQWVVNGYSATFAGFMLVTGSLADRYGRRRTFLAGVASFSVCALVSAVVTDIVLLDLARALAGIGAAATVTGASAMLAQVFTGAARTRIFGLFGATIGLGLAFGPTLAGLLMESFGWRSTFGLPGAIGLIALAFFRFLPDFRSAPGNAATGRMDWAGTTTFTLALMLLILVFVEGPELGWTSPLVLLALLGAVVLFPLFIRIERRAADPLLDLRLLTSSRFLGLCAANIAIVAVFGPLVVYLPSYFMSTQPVTAAQAGALVILLTGPMLVVPILCGMVTRWVSPSVQVIAALVLVGAGAAWFAATEEYAGPLLLMGVGIAIATGLLDGLAVSSMPAEQSGMAAGLFNTTKLTGETLGIAVIGAVLAARTSGTLAGPEYPAAMDLSLWVLGALCVGVAVLVAVLFRLSERQPVAASIGERDHSASVSSADS